jgi:hypothetical protein
MGLGPRADYSICLRKKVHAPQKETPLAMWVTGGSTSLPVWRRMLAGTLVRNDRGQRRRPRAVT